MNELGELKTGWIFKYNHQKGYGWIRGSLDNSESFLHVSDCNNFIPDMGLKVTFRMGLDRWGRRKAIDITNITNGANDGTMHK